MSIFTSHNPCDGSRHAVCVSDLSCHKKYMSMWQTTLGGHSKWFAIFLQLSFWQLRRSFEKFTKTAISFICKWISFWTLDLPSNYVRLHSQQLPCLLVTKLPDSLFFFFLETAIHPQCCKLTLFRSLLFPHLRMRRRMSFKKRENSLSNWLNTRDSPALHGI